MEWKKQTSANSTFKSSITHETIFIFQEFSDRHKDREKELERQMYKQIETQREEGTDREREKE